MVMDSSLREFRFDDYFIDQNGFKQEDPLLFLDRSIADLPFIPSEQKLNCNGNSAPCLGLNPEGNSAEDSEIFSDIALKYISQMLLEEDVEEKSYYQESPALQAAEKPFYEILGEKYPPSPDHCPVHVVDHNPESLDDNIAGNCGTNYNSGNSSNSADGGWTRDAGDYSLSQNMLFVATDLNPQSSSISSNGTSYVVDGLEDSPTNTNAIGVSDTYSDSLSVRQFQRGVEEAIKFLPNSNSLMINMEKNRNGFLNGEAKGEAKKGPDVVKVKAEKRDEKPHSGNGWRGRKNPHPHDLDLEAGRSNKQTAVFSEGTVRSEIFDKVLLYDSSKCNSPLSDHQETFLNGVSNKLQNGQAKGTNGGKSRGKKQGRREVVDLRTILIQCAQAVAADDRRTGSELLKQIRQHSSCYGDGSQRLAYWFAEGLEARLAGTGSQLYKAPSSLKKCTAVDILKAFQLFLAACPFKKISHFFANQTILNTVENASRLHVVDFGINFGFQWPSLLQRLGTRPCGPPKVRITGIDLPESGFRPTRRIEETGRRLADYAQEFNIPFEYASIACSKWETIQVEDLMIERDEVLVVHCSYQFSKLLDETVAVDSPRDIVLKTIRKMNPDVFIHGIINGAYNAPFFITRFREALFHWSSLFDMLETNVPREQQERLLMEKELFGREAINVIACEGAERVERPETYKQWQVRTLRAGFKQLPLNQDIMKKSRDKVRSSYHKDFVIDENLQWLLQGWKGRIAYGMSTWKPDIASYDS